MSISLKGKRIALVGGAGFIGHNLAIEYKRLGAEVAVIDGLTVNNLLAFATTESSQTNSDLYTRIIFERLRLLKEAGIAVYVQDARDYHGLGEVINHKFKANVIVHLAAVAHANRSNKDPYSTFDHSFRTLENALDCARDMVDQFVYFSSSMVYGDFPDGFVTEETPCTPKGIYGALKFGGEKLVIAYNQVFKLPFTIVRPSALYGERCVSRRVGQIFIENALQGLEITVNGDGSDRLDFTYIDDLVEGLVKVVAKEESKNQIFNLTYGYSQSISEMIEILTEHFPGVKVHFLPKDDLMPDRGTLSVDKARALLGYEPSWPLKRGFPKYIGWYKELFRDIKNTGKINLLF
jgi:nucleoside-diphosphate-sugar epimerase